MSPVMLDGIALARRRAPLLEERAAAVRRRRGRAPAFVLVAFSDGSGNVPHVGRKLRLCAAAGIDLTPLVLSPGIPTGEAIDRMHDVLNEGAFDGVFLQFPFPDAIDGDVFASAIPVELDIDVMTPARAAEFMAGTDPLPPVTVAAGLMLLDAYDVSITDCHGILLAEESPFSLMFREALALRGARMDALVGPHADDLKEQVCRADLVVAAAAIPRLVRSSTLAAGAVAIDAGYFNDGGVGDIDLSAGFGHLRALAPVPGGIGPMTVSALIERVILFAERA